MKAHFKNISPGFWHGLKFLSLLFLFSGSLTLAVAQCPENIDFESGTFNGWQCWKGTVASPNNINTITWTPNGPVAPDPTRHIMLSSFPFGDGLDQYGHFPRNCPNGSGHSIQLGNNGTGRQAEGISYTFTIPANQNEYNLIYHYAVVLQDPGHHEWEQPRMQITVTNVTDGGLELPCPLAPFVPPGLPGFDTSDVSPPSGIVVYKKWAAATVKLNNLAGKTIELFFKTADCTLGAHFGYAYIDVNSECSSSFTGAVFCPDDAFINVTAPAGYQNYTWWNSTFTQQLGTTQTINFTPPPPPGTQIAVIVEPFAGYGCKDTLYANLLDTLTIQSQAGPDQVSCNGSVVQLGVIPKPGYVYSWSPAAGLNNPNISNPIATPAVTTQYIVTTSHEGGGCVSKDTVMVYVSNLDNTLHTYGPTTFCADGITTCILEVAPADSIQWYRDGFPITGANGVQYNVLQTGSYYATVFSNTGCTRTTVITTITVNAVPDAAFTTAVADQCFFNNQFNFTNNSTIAAGTMQYDWDFGDLTSSTAPSPTHNYTAPGTYTVRLIATSDKGCKDTSYTTVNIYPMPVASFAATTAAQQCFAHNQFSFTNNSSITAGTLQYKWDFGDGTTSTAISPTHNYTLFGTYIVKLVVTSDKGCKDSMSYNAIVDASPLSVFSVDNKEQCFRNNQFVFTNTSSVLSGTMLYNWDMGDGNTRSTKDVTYSYTQPGNYTVKLLAITDKGCKDSSYFNVIVNPDPVASFTINAPIQCLAVNQFVVNNTSTILYGTMQYTWDLGDGTMASSTHVTHTYAAEGKYYIQVTATSGKGCVDNTISPVTILPPINADFVVEPATICTNMNMHIVNTTINRSIGVPDYLWDFGNGQGSSIKNPVYSYPAPGPYTVKLSASFPQCPQIVTVKMRDVNVESALPGIRYPDKTAIYNFAEQLHARQMGVSVLWTPANDLDNRFSYSPIYKGVTSRLYTIQLKSPVGCITIDTQFVKALKKIEIYVPTAFTPGSNGINDYLRPMLYGFDHVNYFRVYNRWGQLLYQVQGDRPGWDGKLKGIPQPTQTVVWMIEAVDVDGVVHKQQGTTVLLR